MRSCTPEDSVMCTLCSLSAHACMHPLSCHVYPRSAGTTMRRAARSQKQLITLLKWSTRPRRGLDSIRPSVVWQSLVGSDIICVIGAGRGDMEDWRHVRRDGIPPATCRCTFSAGFLYFGVRRRERKVTPPGKQQNNQWYDRVRFRKSGYNAGEEYTTLGLPFAGTTGQK